MTDERAVRMAMEAADLVKAIRTYTDSPGHASGNCGPCILCATLARYDRRGQA